MKKICYSILSILVIFSLSGCYTMVGTINESETSCSNDDEVEYEEAGQGYFDEEDYTMEIDSSYELADTDSLEDEEPGFFENIITEIIAGFSNISNNEDNMIMIFNGDNVFYIVNSDNSSRIAENSSIDQNQPPTRNTGDRNYNSRK